MTVRRMGGSKTWTDTGKVSLTFDIEVVGRFSRFMDGQDIDGNRGMWRTELDHVEITGIKCDDFLTPMNFNQMAAWNDALFGTFDVDRIQWANDGEEGE